MTLDTLSPKLRQFFAAFAILGLLGFSVGCASSSMEEAGDDIEDAADEIGDEIEDAADEID